MPLTRKLENAIFARQCAEDDLDHLLSHRDSWELKEPCLFTWGKEYELAYDDFCVKCQEVCTIRKAIYSQEETK